MRSQTPYRSNPAKNRSVDALIWPLIWKLLMALPLPIILKSHNFFQILWWNCLSELASKSPCIHLKRYRSQSLGQARWLWGVAVEPFWWISRMTSFVSKWVCFLPNSQIREGVSRQAKPFKFGLLNWVRQRGPFVKGRAPSQESY